MSNRVVKTKAKPVGTQTLLRGLELLQCVGQGLTTTKELTDALDVPRSTVTRTLASLVSEGYLYQVPYRGYFLGARLIELGQLASEQVPLVDIARPYLESLAEITRDTVHFGICDGKEVVYLDKLSGMRGAEMRSRIGVRMPALVTGMGKAIVSKLDESQWPFFYSAVQEVQANDGERPSLRSYAEVAEDLRASGKRGWTYDWEENEYGIRCVAAPICAPSGGMAAISVTSVISFMPEERMKALGPDIKATADAISQALNGP